MLEDIPLEESEVGDCLKKTFTAGWYSDRNAASSAVSKNQADIRELLYNYAVIEEANEGLYSRVTNEWWYEWDEDNEKYAYLPKKPPLLRGITGFGIG